MAAGCAACADCAARACRRRAAGNETLGPAADVASRARPRPGHRRPHLVRRGVRPRAGLRALFLRGAARARRRGPLRLPGLTRRAAAQYVDAIRHGDLDEFKRIEAASGDWWFPTLDRGAGAALHIAVDHAQARQAAPHCCAACAHAWRAQIEAVRFLLDERGAEVNQQDRELGWTPLHRAARMCVPAVLAR